MSKKPCGRTRLPKFKFSAKYPIGLHVTLQIQIKNNSKMPIILCEHYLNRNSVGVQPWTHSFWSNIKWVWFMNHTVLPYTVCNGRVSGCHLNRALRASSIKSIIKTWLPETKETLIIRVDGPFWSFGSYPKISHRNVNKSDTFCKLYFGRSCIMLCDTILHAARVYILPPTRLTNSPFDPLWKNAILSSKQ